VRQPGPAVKPSPWESPIPVGSAASEAGSLHCGPVRFPRAIAAFSLMLGILAGAPAGAESAFVLPRPLDFGRIPAATYDAAGKRIGEAKVDIEPLKDGRILMTAQSASRDGARTLASAWFAALDPKRSVRLLREESSSLDASGHSLGHLIVDHEARIATCEASDGAKTERVKLPARDRVVNVPMNLLFMPLVRGEKRSVKFELFLCRNGARTMDFEAWVQHSKKRGARPIEVRYGPDLGSVVSLVARSFVPRLSFWFDPAEPHEWVGHRLPLYSGGPEVLVVREGIPAGSLPN
jgi:hypothetical protein